MNINTNRKKNPDNLTRWERKAFNKLINNPTLIINKADKDSTVVVQDRNDYNVTKAMKHFADQNTYKKL